MSDYSKKTFFFLFIVSCNTLFAAEANPDPAAAEIKLESQLLALLQVSSICNAPIQPKVAQVDQLRKTEEEVVAEEAEIAKMGKSLMGIAEILKGVQPGTQGALYQRLLQAAPSGTQGAAIREALEAIHKGRLFREALEAIKRLEVEVPVEEDFDGDYTNIFKK